MKPRVVLDPGHGGRDPGAIGPSGVREKDIVLTVARLLRDELRPVAQVRLTRDADTGLALGARAEAANAWRAGAFVSIHCNAAVNRKAHGFEVFTSPGQDQSDALAEHIITAVAAAFPDLRMRRDLADGDSDKEARFTVLLRSQVPAVLVEMAFLSNPREEALLVSPGWQRRMAGALARGLTQFAGVTLPEGVTQT